MLVSRIRSKGGVLQNQLFDLIECSHGFKAIVTAMFMALIIFISAIRKKKLMYLWLRVTHSCNLPIYGKLEINEKLHRIQCPFVFTNSTITLLSAQPEPSPFFCICPQNLVISGAKSPKIARYGPIKTLISTSRFRRYLNRAGEL